MTNLKVSLLLCCSDKLSADLDTSTTAPKPKKKVAKTSGKKGKAGGGGRGKKNKLEVFNTMPLDVLREVSYALSASCVESGEETVD